MLRRHFFSTAMHAGHKFLRAMIWEFLRVVGTCWTIYRDKWQLDGDYQGALSLNPQTLTKTLKPKTLNP